MGKIESPIIVWLAVTLLGTGTPVTCQPDRDLKPHHYSTTYVAPRFEDQGRAEKIERAISKAHVIFEECAAKNHLPGLVYGVVVDDRLVLSGGLGILNVSTNQPAGSNSFFRIASMTKSFTAMAIIKLRDEGLLSLQDPVSKYIPELTSLVYLTQDARPVTIYNLLTMTSGFPEDNPWGDRFLDMTDQEFTQLLGAGLSFSAVPSRGYEYSNLGYGMLGKVISRVSGMPYHEYITDLILLPLGMNNTHWEYADAPAKELASGYRWEDASWKEEPMLHHGAFGAMGGLITSIEDFSKYVSFHLSAWPSRNDVESGPLCRSSVREMHEMHTPGQQIESWRFGNQNVPLMTGYGYGLKVAEDHQGIREAGHNGGLPGFGSSYIFYPDHGIGLMAFTNLTYAGGTVKSALYEVMFSIIEQGLFNPRVMQASKILAQRKDEVIELISSWDSELEKVILAKNFFMDRSREARMEDAAKALDYVGEMISIGSLMPENQLRGSFLIQGTRGAVEIFFTLTPEASPRIQWLSFHYK